MYPEVFTTANKTRGGVNLPIVVFVIVMSVYEAARAFAGYYSRIREGRKAALLGASCTDCRGQLDP